MITMGKSSSKQKKLKEPKGLFEWQKQVQDEKDKKRQLEGNKMAGPRRPPVNILRTGSVEPPAAGTPTRTAGPEAPAMNYDLEATERMRNQLKGDANAFLLNNIMLSVQFFENYEQVMWDLKNNSVTDADVMLNDKMASHHKHVFLPDKLHEAVHAHARAALPGRPVEPLQPQRMFVVHDNVEVSEPGEVSDYSTVLDAPFYRMLMEEDDEPGYVKLKKLEILENKIGREETIAEESMTKPQYSSDSDNESEDSEVKSKDEEVREGRNFMNELKEKIDKPVKTAFKKPANLRLNSEEPVNGDTGPKSSRKLETKDIASERRPSGKMKHPNRAVVQGSLRQSETKPKRGKQKQTVTKISPSGSESSGYKTSHSPPTESSGNESDYGYTTITAETTPKRLQKSLTANVNDSTSIIPAKCISVVDVRRAHNDSDEEDDIDEAYMARYGSEYHRELYKKMYYLNSVNFMGNFSDIFVMKLASALGFTSDSLSEALTQGASIYCNISKGSNKSTSFEILPALSTTWPSAAQGWIVRRRNMIRNPRTQYVYQWPTQYMVSKARGLGCLIVPLGFRPTRGYNPEQSLQWKLTFPAVERYLETCLAHSHVRCYLFTLLLFKSFMKSNESKAGLDYTHVRNHLFWQCEDNYAMWPEDRLGETLRIFLKSFYQSMMKGKMHDYFIPKGNLYKGIPKSVFLKQQRMLADIVESPVMHLMASLRNLKYVKSNFYPVLNYQRLYNILTCDDVLKLINPNLPNLGDLDEEDPNKEFNEKIGFWEDIKRPKDILKDPRDNKVRDPAYQWRKQQLRQIEAKKAAESLVNSNRKMKDLIDRKKVVPPHLDAQRRRLVLELFIPHFLAMAECSEKHEANRQGIIYLEHANRLSIVLREEPGGEGQGREYIAIIKEKIEILKNKVATTGAPEVPKRNESFSSNPGPRPGPSGVKQKPKPESYVNLENVNTIETPGTKIADPVSPTVKLASIVLADVHVEKERPKFIRSISFQKVEEESENEEDNSDDDVTESRL